MKLKPQTMIFAQRLIFTLLCLAVLGLLAYLSRQSPLSFDWSAGARNSLSAASREILERLPERLRFTGFVSSEASVRGAMTQLVARYQRQRPDIELVLVNPRIQPALAEQYAVQSEGELVIDYQGRRQHVRRLTEAALSSALARLGRGGDRWAAVLEAASNRHLSGGKRTDLDQLASHLESQGMKLRRLDADSASAIPDNVSVLVIFQLIKPLPRHQRELIRDYLKRGGNLLWFADPGSRGYLAEVADAIGVHIEAGMLVDPNSRIGTKLAPEFIQVHGYADHPVSAGLQGPGIFPTAAGLSWQAPPGWQVRGIAASPLNSWRETGDLNTAVRFDEGLDSPGPADIAVALERSGIPGRAPQRVFVVGDSDFASNAYLGLGANRALAANIFNWLSADDTLIDMPVLTAMDLDFNPQPWSKAVIVLGAPIVLPLLLITVGLLRWQRRRRR